MVVSIVWMISCLQVGAQVKWNMSSTWREKGEPVGLWIGRGSASNSLREGRVARATALEDVHPATIELGMWSISCEAASAYIVTLGAQGDVGFNGIKEGFEIPEDSGVVALGKV